MSTKKLIISGGGTGGHIFPAIAIANALKEAKRGIEILFVGACGKIEMTKVPDAGYEIVGLPIRGFVRKINFNNVKVVFNLFRSLFLAFKIVRSFKPDVVVGVGGYASGPVLFIANFLKIPTLIQEQNSYAGITNKILSKKAKKICVAYPNMQMFFPKKEIVLTGNPVRKTLYKNTIEYAVALEHFDLNIVEKTLLILGGSGGAGSINNAVINNIELLIQSDVQVIWQTGAYYFEKSEQAVIGSGAKNIKVMSFIKRMDYAYHIADLVISRAGAGTISELCLLAKPVILVPSPNVAEDHQTKNAMALWNKQAAVLVKDGQAKELIIPEALRLLNNKTKLLELSENIKLLGIEDSDKQIANEIFKLMN